MSNNMAKILATSDLHGNLPEVDPCDLLLIGGDICPDLLPAEQANWLNGAFRRWLHKLYRNGVKTIVGIAGNHDFIFENPHAIEDLGLPWTYLRDSETTVEGVKIYGIPWVPNLPSWAFYASKEALHGHYLAIPKDIDIVLAHGPPHGYGDRVRPNHRNLIGESVGCKSSVDMMNRAKPKVLITGHIHEGFGHYIHKSDDHHVQIYNVSYVDEFYDPRWQIIEIDLGEDVISDAQQEQKESDDTKREIHTALACA